MARLIARFLLPLSLLAGSLGAVAPGPAGAALAAAGLEKVSISMGYIPNVQFAAYYVADARGYYKAANLQVSFNYAQAPNIIQLIGNGSLDFGNAEGDQVLVGRAHGLPVETVFTQYQRFPVVIFALQSSGIRRFADLRGKTVGISGLYGASYTGLLAALGAAHLSRQDVHISPIGYTQPQAVIQHRVDAAVGFGMNEPVLLRSQGYKVTVLPIADLVPLVGPGIITSESMVASHGDLVRRFVQATLRGQQDTNRDPSAAFAISRRYMPSIAADQLPYQQAVLREAVHYWQPPTGKALGCSVPASWSATAATLLAQHQLSAALDSRAAYTNRFLSGC